MKKRGNKPENLTIKTDVEMAEKNCDEPLGNQLSPNNELAVSNDVENIVKSKKSQKRDKKRKKKGQESFNDSVNDSILEVAVSPSTTACDTNEEPHKKKHKKKGAVNDNEVSSENNAVGNILSSVCNPKATNLELGDEVMTIKGIGLSEGVDDTLEIRSEANTVDNEEPSKKKHKKGKKDKKRQADNTELLSENNLEGNLYPSICNTNATTNVELATEYMTDSEISLSKGIDDTPEKISEASTLKNEESQKEKHKKRKKDKKRAANNSELLSENNSDGNMTDSEISLSKGIDDTPEKISEASTLKNEESQKEKHKKRKKDKKRAANNSELLSENNSDGNMTDSEISLSKGIDDTPEKRSEASTLKNEESQKEKHKKRKKDKNRAANNSELLSENNSDGNMYPSVYNPNVTTTNLELATKAMTVSGIILSSGVDDTPEIRSEANTVKNKAGKKKRNKKKRKTDKMSAANGNELLSENNLDGNLYPSDCNPNAATNLELPTQIMTADGIISSKVVDDAPEIRSEANTVNSEVPQKKKKSKRKKTKNNVPSDIGTSDNNLKDNIPPLMEVCVSNISINLELADKNSDEASQLVNQQLVSNETSSKGGNNSNEINLVSNALKSDSPQKKIEHKKMMIDNEDIGDKGLEAKNIEITHDNRLLPAIENEHHTPRRFGRRKLLVLDLNGLLCEVIRGYPKTKKPYKRVNRSAVFKRPFCDDFMKFCRENFDIGVWSSRKMENVYGVVNVIMEDFKDDLLFCWSASECTYTRHKTIEDYRKPLVLKKLQKLWNKEAGNLPWELGDYSPSNTLLIDDSPYKAICNPPYTGVFPCPYNYNDENDNALGPGGDLRVYLEGLALAEDVESYVREHPFGKPAITDANPSWSFYEKIIEYY